MLAEQPTLRRPRCWLNSKRRDARDATAQFTLGGFGGRALIRHDNVFHSRRCREDALLNLSNASPELASFLKQFYGGGSQYLYRKG